MIPDAPRTDLLLLEGALWLLTAQTGISIYDFDFRAWFHTQSALDPPANLNAVARVGAVRDYRTFHDKCREDGIVLIHSPDEQLRASQLDRWYPLLSDLTPRSLCFQGRPTLAQIKEKFNWPVFMKGARQTSRHQRTLSIIDSDAAFESAMELYRRDPILGWQDVVCREFVPLRRLSDSDPDGAKMPRCFEFRTFWWKAKLAGAGRYWWEGPAYDWTADERAAGLEIAREAARRVNVPFLVVDLAQTESGRWLVIECNDGQESGYAGVSPIGLWQTILDYEKVKA